MRFPNPQKCVLSIVEGRSDGGTYEVLDGLRSSMDLVGIRYILQTNDINSSAQGQDRVKALAALRNLAVQDLSAHAESYDADTIVIFSNDIIPYMEDILEIIHQRKALGADQACAMDPTFYDVWIARGMTGEFFFNLPEDGNYNSAWNLFWNDATAHSRWASSKPFQVFGCWNGVTAFTAKPLMQKTIAFRTPKQSEYYQGEPRLFAKDMWFHGYGKIAVVPSVNDSDEAATRIKALEGYTSSHVANNGEDKSEWEMRPPDKVRCKPGDDEASWAAWDEELR